MTRTANPLLLRLLLAAALAAASLSAVAADELRLDCAPFPLPDAKLTWVAPGLVFNGLPMQVRQFESKDSPQAILAHYRREWRGTPQRPGNIEYPLGEWQVIATLKERCFYTVQVKPTDKGSAGLLGVSRLPDPSQVQEAGKHFPMMSGSHVINDIDHRDAGKRGRTLLFVNEFSPDTNAAFYRRTLGAEGWSVIADHALPVGNQNAHVLTLKRGLNETSMTISRNGENTTVLVNLVDRP